MPAVLIPPWADTSCLCGNREFSLHLEGRYEFFPVDGAPFPFRVLRCRVCGLGVTDPRPGRHIAHRTDGDAAVVESQQLVETSNYRLRKIERFMQPGWSVLEIGCSTGKLVELLAQSGAGRSIGVELHRPTVNFAVARGRSVLGASLHDCAFGDRQFDLVNAHHVLEHVEDLDGLLREVHRILVPGGLVFATVPCHRSPFVRDSNWHGWFPQEHFWHFDLPTLRDLFARHEFATVRLSRPLYSDFATEPGPVGACKRVAKDIVRAIGLGDTVEAWFRRR